MDGEIQPYLLHQAITQHHTYHRLGLDPVTQCLL